MLINIGFCKESVKKKDGSTYDLNDLMKINAQNMKSSKDSISWLTEPSSTASMDGGQTTPMFFCEYCLMVQSIPTKHCKLCESCCPKFDHHCLYICNCVGLKNHRTFIYFLISSITCTNIFLFSLYCYFSDYNQKLIEINKNKPFEDQINLLYMLFSSTMHIWFSVLVVVNGFSIFMVLFLLLYQFKFISLGFTSQFPPPIAFANSHKRMNTFLTACMHRMDNLYTFFFESCESNQELYYKQQSEYRQSVTTSKAIPVGYYPKNNFDTLNAYSNSGVAAGSKNLSSNNLINMNPIDPNNQSINNFNFNDKTPKAGHKNDQFEIALD